MSRLLIVNVSANVGSTGKIAEEIGLLAITKGWECHFAFGRDVCMSRQNTIKTSSALDVLIHYAENLFLDREGLGSRGSTKSLIRKIKTIRPDIIHIHNIHDHWLNYKILFEYLNTTDIKVVWTLHDCWPFTGHCYHFDAIHCNRWKSSCHDCPLRYKHSLDRSRENFVLKKNLFTENKNLTIVPVSYWMEGLVRESFLKDNYTKTIHNGVDLNVFKPSESDWRQKFGLGKSFVILGVSSVWQNYKGLKEFVKLSQNSNYKVVMVGVPDEIKKTLPREVIAVSRTSNSSELAALYSLADVFVNPTYNDTFPTVNLEALACGTPVVTYKTGGSPEAVDETTGIVVEKGHYDELVAAIEEIQSQGKQHYSDACRRRAEECFDKNKCFANYINLYEDLLN